jgi:hypothetical protein
MERESGESRAAVGLMCSLRSLRRSTESREWRCGRVAREKVFFTRCRPSMMHLDLPTRCAGTSRRQRTRRGLQSGRSDEDPPRSGFRPSVLSHRVDVSLQRVDPPASDRCAGKQGHTCHITPRNTATGTSHRVRLPRRSLQGGRSSRFRLSVTGGHAPRHGILPRTAQPRRASPETITTVSNRVKTNAASRRKRLRLPQMRLIAYVFPSASRIGNRAAQVLRVHGRSDAARSDR